MLELLEYLISILTNDATLNAIVPVSQIFTGPVDVVQESQTDINIPQISLWVVSEVSRSVPTRTRDSQIQIDIWSRNSQLEIETIYERIITLLNYNSGAEGSAYMFWMRLGGTNDMYESDKRLWHRPMTIRVWSMK
jgi:hypothetical protein